MANMTYCMFENTSSDLADVISRLEENHWDVEYLIDNASSAHEASAIKRLIEQCREISKALDV